MHSFIESVRAEKLQAEMSETRTALDWLVLAQHLGLEMAGEARIQFESMVWGITLQICAHGTRVEWPQEEV